MLTYYPACPEDTAILARSFAQSLKPGSVLCFFGDLGAGKTTFIKALAQGLGVAPELVISPTFQYLNVYQGHCGNTPCPIFHFDLYRLRGQEEFLLSGFHEFLSKDGIACIEWAEKIADILPDDVIHIRISHLNKEDLVENNIDTRKVEITIPS